MNRTDITYRMERSGTMALTKTLGERVCNIVQMMFHTVPGTDDYNKDMGLDIAAQSQRPYTNGTRDTEYEMRIVQQFSTYTDLIISNVIAVYDNRYLYVYLEALLDGETIRVRVSSGPENIEILLEPKEILPNVYG